MNSTPTVLAIDTSCDDTSVAITTGTTILTNVVSSQTELHKPYGGVFPTVAKQAHNENIEPAIHAALRNAQKEWKDIDAVAVTQGPGLAPSLEVGIRHAVSWAEKQNKPLIPINHIEGHILSVLACPKTQLGKSLEFALPALAVIISGGHSQFILVEKKDADPIPSPKDSGAHISIEHPFSYTILGSSIDDAAGECLDKVGRMLGLGYPAGPVIESLAKDGDPKAYPFPLPMTTTKNYNLSFSGLKTYARNLIEQEEASGDLNKTQIIDFCASLQYGVFRHICYKLNKILEKHEIEEIWLGGGVAANMNLRQMIRTTTKAHAKKMSVSKTQIPLRVPYTKKLCSDNAAMIGVAAGLKDVSGFGSIKNSDKKTEQMDRKPRWNVEEI